MGSTPSKHVLVDTIIAPENGLSNLNKFKHVAVTKKGAFYSSSTLFDDKLDVLNNGTNFVYLPSPKVGTNHIVTAKPGAFNSNEKKIIYVVTSEPGKKS
jgi:hypothetical protein